VGAVIFRRRDEERAALEARLAEAEARLEQVEAAEPPAPVPHPIYLMSDEILELLPAAFRESVYKAAAQAQEHEGKLTAVFMRLNELEGKTAEVIENPAFGVSGVQALEHEVDRFTELVGRSMNIRFERRRGAARRWTPRPSTTASTTGSPSRRKPGAAWASANAFCSRARGCRSCQRERSTYWRPSISRFACLKASWLTV
jgi:hypothetical protein